MTKTKTTKKSSKQTDDYNAMKVADLKDLCKARGLSAGGLKSEIVKRLSEGEKKSSKKTKVVPVEESEEENSSESEQEVPVKKGKSKASVKKTKVPVEESEEESTSASEEEVPVVKSKKTVAPKSKSKAVPKKAGKKPVVEESEDDDSSSSEEVPVKSKKAVKKPVVESSEDENSSVDEEASEVPAPKKSKAKGKSKSVPKKTGKKPVVPVVEESEDESNSTEEEVPVPKKSKAKAKTVPAEETPDESNEEDDTSVKNFESLLDKDIDHYYIDPSSLLDVLWRTSREVLSSKEGELNEEKHSEYFRLFTIQAVENLRQYGFGEAHSMSKTKKTPVVKGAVAKAKPEQPKKEQKKAKKTVRPPVEEDDVIEDDDSQTPGPMTVTFDENFKAFRLNEFVYDFENKSVIGKISGEDIIPIDKSDGAKLLDQDIRFVVLGSQEELDAILQKNRDTRTERLSEDEGPPEGEDDGKDAENPDDENATTQVETGISEITERTAPEITEEKFKRFITAQHEGANKADYVAIASAANLTDMEGQEIMGNYNAYCDRFPTVVAAVVMKKVSVKSSLGTKTSTLEEKPGRKMIKK